MATDNRDPVIGIVQLVCGGAVLDIHGATSGILCGLCLLEPVFSPPKCVCKNILLKGSLRKPNSVE